MGFSLPVKAGSYAIANGESFACVSFAVISIQPPTDQHFSRSLQCIILHLAAMGKDGLLRECLPRAAQRNLILSLVPGTHPSGQLAVPDSSTHRAQNCHHSKRSRFGRPSDWSRGRHNCFPTSRHHCFRYLRKYHGHISPKSCWSSGSRDANSDNNVQFSTCCTQDGCIICINMHLS
jgi:hypothetical protein